MRRIIGVTAGVMVSIFTLIMLTSLTKDTAKAVTQNQEPLASVTSDSDTISDVFPTFGLFSDIIYYEGETVATDEFKYLASNAFETVQEVLVTKAQSEVAAKVEETAKPEPTKEPEEESVYKNLGISIAPNYLNVRKQPNEEGEIIAKLYKGALARIHEEDGTWAKITSGNVEGYVSMEYLAIGKKAESIADLYITDYAKVTTTTLQVRKEMSTESDILTKIPESSSHMILEEYDEWVKINVSDSDIVGYISKRYVKIKSDYETAITIEDEQKMLEEEEQLKQQETTKTPEPSKASEPTKKPEASKEPQQDTVETISSGVDEVTLLASLIFTEAGFESYEGKLAVASVVMNRVKSSRYPNTIYRVVTQKSQFSPYASGRLATQVKRFSSYSTKNELDCIKAAKEALSGVDNVNGATSFRIVSIVSDAVKEYATIIGNHAFW